MDEHTLDEQRGGYPLGILALMLFCSAHGLVSITSRDLEAHDGPRVAGIAREMVLRGDFAIPYLNGEPFLEYPSLGYVPIALLTEWADPPPDFLPLLASILVGVGTIYLTYRTARLLSGRRVGLVAGFFLATTFGFYQLNRRCLVDPSLVFWVTCSLYGFVSGQMATQRSFRRFALFYLGLACAFLSKGLIGIAIPGAVVCAFLVVQRDWATVRKMKPLFGVGVFAAPLLAWGLVAYRAGGGDSVWEVVRQSLWRFSSATADHSKPFYYYAGPVLYLSLPWIALLAIPLWLRWGPPRFKGRLFPGREGLLPLVWIGVTVLGLSVASAKRHIYLGPIFPAVAILLAQTWERVSWRVPRLRRLAWTAPVICFVIFGASHFVFQLPRDSERSVRPFFEDIAREAGEAEMLLFHPTECCRGATVFYLGRTAPVVWKYEELEDALQRPGRLLVVTNPPKDQSPFWNRETPEGLRLLAEHIPASGYAFYLFERP